MMKLDIFIVMSVLMFCVIVTSCEDFVDVEVPNNKIVSQAIFESDEMAVNAMNGVYNELFNAEFSRGWQKSVTVLAGMSADILQPINSEHPTLAEFYQNKIGPESTANLDLWSSAYNIIYMVNAILEGIKHSDSLTEETRIRLEAESRFIRAFTYFNLVNLYGDVPNVLTTDYRINSLVIRESVEIINAQVLSDLEFAKDVLDEIYFEEERTHVNKYVVLAFLARVHLYQQNWELAENFSNQVISNTDAFEIMENLNQVFLANSKEAIWQISPIGRGNILTSTNEGSVFIGTSFSAIKLVDEFVGSISQDDKRLLNWINHFSSSTRNFYYPYKYKDRSSLNNITEYSMVLRLAEQYLIRAEARARQGKLIPALTDLNIIRDRAGVGLISNANSQIEKEELLGLILKERKIELFSEWGHRWFDLKRNDKATEILGVKKPNWKETDILYPIPQEERSKNPNLGQNNGY